jgi:hypothetical protein
MTILPIVLFALAFLGFLGIGVFVFFSKKARTTENSLFENIEEDNPDSHKVYCDAYSVGMFDW